MAKGSGGGGRVPAAERVFRARYNARQDMQDALDTLALGKGTRTRSSVFIGASGRQWRRDLGRQAREARRRLIEAGERP